MIGYIRELLGDVAEAAKRGDAQGVHYACQTAVQELRQLDRRDFSPDVQADFVRLVGVLDHWGKDIRGVDVVRVWPSIEPPLRKVLDGYAGEGSRGDPEFNRKQAERTAFQSFPPELGHSLPLFTKDHPDPGRCAFIMMQFGKTRVHEEIATTIRASLDSFGIAGLRADDRDYHEDLFPNVLTYIHGCSFGVAVFDRLEGDDFSPNVALEVGYMRALRKPLCLLKDQTLRTLPTDLVGKLYKSFDPQNVAGTIPQQLEKWLGDRGMIKA